MKNYLLLLFLLVFSGPAALRAQTWQWAMPWQGPLPAYDAVKLLPDGSGNTIVAGGFTGTLTLGSTTLSSRGGSDAFVAWLSPTGTWLRAFSVGGSGNEVINALALDAAGNVVVAGYFGGTVAFGTSTLSKPNGQSDMFVGRISPAGTWLQAVQASAAVTPSAPRAYCVAAAPNGDIVVAGTFLPTAITIGSFTLTNASCCVSTDAFVARLNAAGTWTQALRLGNTQYETPVGLAIDHTNTVVLAVNGSFGIQFPNVNGQFVARLDAAGTWTQAVPVPEYIAAMQLAPDGDVVLAGFFSSLVATFGSITLPNAYPDGQSTDIYLARLSPAGTWRQATRLGGPHSDYVRALALDAAGNTVLAGRFGGASTQLGSVTLTNSNPTGAFGDAFVARQNAAGSWQALPTRGLNTETIDQISFDGTDGVVVLGAFDYPTVSFGPTTLSTPNNVTAGFVARVGGLVTAAGAPAPATVATLSPNPAREQVLVRWPTALPAGRPLQLLDALGRCVREQAVAARATEARLPLTGLPSGLYLVRCGPARGRLLVE